VADEESSYAVAVVVENEKTLEGTLEAYMKAKAQELCFCASGQEAVLKPVSVSNIILLPFQFERTCNCFILSEFACLRAKRLGCRLGRTPLNMTLYLSISTLGIFTSSIGPLGGGIGLPPRRFVGAVCDLPIPSRPPRFFLGGDWGVTA
jgi:hypothetical protein